MYLGCNVVNPPLKINEMQHVAKKRDKKQHRTPWYIPSVSTYIYLSSSFVEKFEYDCGWTPKRWLLYSAILDGILIFFIEISSNSSNKKNLVNQVTSLVDSRISEADNAKRANRMKWPAVWIFELELKAAVDGDLTFVLHKSLSLQHCFCEREEE